MVGTGGVGGVNTRLYIVLIASIFLTGLSVGIIQAFDTSGTTQNPLFVILFTPLVLGIAIVGLRKRVKGTGLGG